MAFEFELPDLGEGLTEGEIFRWLVGEGDVVEEDQPLVEIRTDASPRGLTPDMSVSAPKYLQERTSNNDTRRLRTCPGSDPYGALPSLGPIPSASRRSAEMVRIVNCLRQQARPRPAGAVARRGWRRVLWGRGRRGDAFGADSWSIYAAIGWVAFALFVVNGHWGWEAFTGAVWLPLGCCCVAGTVGAAREGNYF